MNHVTGPPTTDIENTGHAENRYRAEFTVGEHSARHLRRILRSYLTGAGLAEVTDAAELALTELIANVVRHVPGRRCGICFLFVPGGVRVEIADGCPRLPAAGTGDVLAEGGRGLLLVEAVADRWGVEPRPDGRGKTVWFECRAKGEAPGEGLSAGVRPAPRP